MSIVDKYKNLLQVDDRSSQGEVGTPVALVNEMLDKLPEEVFKSSITTFLDPSFGSGTFLIEVIKRLRKEGHSIENIQERVYGTEISHRLYNKVTRLFSNYNFHKLYKEDFLTKDFNNMKFDVQLFNPPFNLSSTSSKTIAGTSGNTTYYRKFIDKAYSLRKDEGVVGIICPRSGISYAQKKYGVSEYNPYTAEHWKFDSGYFFYNGSKTFTNNSPLSILNKIYKMENQIKFSHAIGGSMKGLLEKGDLTIEDKGGVYGLINTPTAKEDKVYGYINTKAYVPEGPKLIFKGLESKRSYTVEHLPHKVGSACTLYFNSLEEAKAAKLFILNSPIMEYLQKVVFEKARGLMFRYIIPFDLTQIKTGYEYPLEFNLTIEEINLIESTVA